jgi:hypothetical protein
MRRALVALLLAAASVGHAESLYVIERLVVGVNDSPEGAGARIATVRSGDRVEVLERFEDETRVRLSSGAEGWVKSAYLSPDLPMRLQLDERTRELEDTRLELNRVIRESSAARAAPPLPTPASAAPLAPAPAADSAALVPTERPMFPSRASGGSQPTWTWVAVACTLALAAGFAIGWRVLDRRIRRKYGGLRIY